MSLAYKSTNAMTCKYCQIDNEGESNACGACGLPFEDIPALTLVTPVETPAGQPPSHPFAHPRRSQIVTSIKNAFAAILIVPTMAAAGGIIGVLFFAAVIGSLDYLYFHPNFSLFYLEKLGHKSLLVGLLAGVPTGAYGAMSGIKKLIKNAGKPLLVFCLILALPFLILPPYRFFFSALKISAPYDLPSGLLGGILIALPFVAFVKLCLSLFDAAFASKRQ